MARPQSSRNRWLVYGAGAVLLGLVLSLAVLLTNPRTSPIIAAATATAAPPTIVAALPTIPAPPTIASTATPFVLPTTATSVLSTPTLLPRLTPPPLPDSWEYEWLRGIPCRAPCWEGITPGKTTAEEALKILKEMLNVNTSGVEDEYDNHESWYQINWFNKSYQLSDFIYLNGTPPNLPARQIVQTIRLDEVPSFQLKDVMKVFGQPTSVDSFAKRYEPNAVSYSVSIKYERQQLSLNLHSSFSDKPSVNPDMWFDSVTFGSWGKGSGAGFTQPWQGYKSFPYYCRAVSPNDEIKAESCDKLLASQTPTAQP